MDSDLVEAITQLVLEELKRSAPGPEPAAEKSGPPVLICPGPARACSEVVEALSRLTSFSLKMLSWEKARPDLLPLGGVSSIVAPADWSERIGSFKAVILTGLDIGGLAAFSRLLTLQAPIAAAVAAVIQGVPVFVCRESLELFERHSSRVPNGVLRVFAEHRRVVESFGVEFVGGDELAVRLGSAPNKVASKSRGRDVVTREDVEAAVQRGAKVLEVSSNAIVTGLARETATRFGIEVRNS